MAKEIVEALVKGGKATAAPPLGPALGPLKVNTAEVINKINEKTKAFEGMDVPVKVIVDTETREFEIEVGTPPVTSMLKKELKTEKLATLDDSGSRKIAGDISFEAIVKIAKNKPSISGDLKAKVKQVLGTCVSSGVTVDGKNPKDVIKEVDEGKYNQQIK